MVICYIHAEEKYYHTSTLTSSSHPLNFFPFSRRKPVSEQWGIRQGRIQGGRGGWSWSAQEWAIRKVKGSPEACQLGGKLKEKEREVSWTQQAQCERYNLKRFETLGAKKLVKRSWCLVCMSSFPLTHNQDLLGQPTHALVVITYLIRFGESLLAG